MPTMLVLGHINPPPAGLSAHFTFYPPSQIKLDRRHVSSDRARPTQPRHILEIMDKLSGEMRAPNGGERADAARLRRRSWPAIRRRFRQRTMDGHTRARGSRAGVRLPCQQARHSRGGNALNPPPTQRLSSDAPERVSSAGALISL